MENNLNRVYCGLVNNEHLNQEIVLHGWVKKIRKLGNLLFLNIGDRTGQVQIILTKDNVNFNIANELTRESVVSIIGKVALRKDPNLELKTGKFEIITSKITIHSIAKQLPMIVEDQTDALEEVRMKNRFLDLRRNKIFNYFLFKSNFINAVSNFLIKKGFVNVETPILGKPTPEGARDYLVPSRLSKNKFYALPQSPQIYKQLLMVSGFDKYFQISKCFRDEDLRSDRQPEFTQLDIEMSFVNEKDIQDNCEQMLKEVLADLLNINIQIPFTRMSYDHAMEFYGSDKPDLRFDLKLNDISNIFLNTNCNILKLSNNEVIKALFLDSIVDKKQITVLEKLAKDNGVNNIGYLFINNKNIDGPIAKFLNQDEINKLLEKSNLVNGTIILIKNEKDLTNKALGAIRNELGSMFNLKNNDLKFAWIIDFPLFEFDKDSNTYVAAHHPFTSPSLDCIDDFDHKPQKAKARSFDLVLNGFELSSGSIRIVNKDLQEKMFNVMGISKEDAYNKFGTLLTAFDYGVPPHGGMAIGIDRLIAILLGVNNIKEVIAFPKNSSAVDVMFDAPDYVDQKELEPLKIKCVK